MAKKLTGFLGSVKRYILKMSWKKRIILLVVIGILFLIFGRKPMTKVTTAKASMGTLTQTISASGKVDADQKADLTFQSGGRVAWVGVKKGDIVKAGQALASLDQIQLNAIYQQSINTYNSLNAAAQKVEDDVKGHSADESLTQRATRMAAQAARDSAYDAMHSAQTALNFAVITAPFAGVMTNVNPAFAGSNVMITNAVYSIVNPTTFFFSTQVGETDVAQVKIGQKVNLKLDAYPDKSLTGEVENIGVASVLTSTGGTAYDVKISLPVGADADFRLGMNGDAEIITGVLTDVLFVPADAVVEEDTGNYVWTVVSGNRAKKIKVEVGASSVDSTQIVSGISQGDTVIVQPPTTIKNGSRLTL